MLRLQNQGVSIKVLNQYIVNEINFLGMQCPYFKKVNFQRIQQRTDTDDQSQKQTMQSRGAESRRKNEFEFNQQSIPEQGLTNNVKVEQYKKVARYDSFNSACCEQFDELQKIITIKMPKSLTIKQLNIKKSSPENLNQKMFEASTGQAGKQNSVKKLQQKMKHIKNWQLSEIEQEVSNRSIPQKCHKQAKVFETHRNLFFQARFQGVIILKKTAEKCLCCFDSVALKIMCLPHHFQQMREEHNFYLKDKISFYKVRYFVDLTKYKFAIETINLTSLQITIIAKGTKETFVIEFLTPQQMCTFECVYSSIINQVSQSQENAAINMVNVINSTQKQYNCQVSPPALYSERSIDSLRFSVERMKYCEAQMTLDTFDIILFKGKNLMSKFQRFFTNSDYDHVGMIIKTIDGNLLLLEATGNVGVAIYTFSSIQIALGKKLYERIAIRKFSSFSRNSLSDISKRLMLLQDFIKQVNGKKYKFSPMYLISTTNKTKRIEDEGTEEETYFCSELVAQALKTCGIMKSNRPSYQFLPKHFGGEDELNCQLTEGYFYSDPIILQR